MNREQLKAAQRPLKERYKANPESAKVTLSATGSLGSDVTCDVVAWHTVIQAGLHPAAGGDGLAACSGDMLLQSLVGCAGVTLSAVATALGIQVRGATLTAEGDLDFRGTLGVVRDAPVGFTHIRLIIELDTEAAPEEQRKLVELTERYCVVYQTLINGPRTSVECRTAAIERV